MYLFGHNLYSWYPYPKINLLEYCETLEFVYINSVPIVKYPAPRLQINFSNSTVSMLISSQDFLVASRMNPILLIQGCLECGYNVLSNIFPSGSSYFVLSILPRHVINIFKSCLKILFDDCFNLKPRQLIRHYYQHLLSQIKN